MYKYALCWDLSVSAVCVLLSVSFPDRLRYSKCNDYKRYSIYSGLCTIEVTTTKVASCQEYEADPNFIQNIGYERYRESGRTARVSTRDTPEPVLECIFPQ